MDLVTPIRCLTTKGGTRVENPTSNLHQIHAGLHDPDQGLPMEPDCWMNLNLRAARETACGLLTCQKRIFCNLNGCFDWAVAAPGADTVGQAPPRARSGRRYSESRRPFDQSKFLPYLGKSISLRSSSCYELQICWIAKNTSDVYNYFF